MGKELKWGYISTQGEFVSSPRYRQAHPFHEVLAAVLVTVDAEITASYRP